jgi:hypothetical protein
MKIKKKSDMDDGEWVESEQNHQNKNRIKSSRIKGHRQ